MLAADPCFLVMCAALHVLCARTPQPPRSCIRSISVCIYLEVKCCGGVGCTPVRVLGRRAALRWWGSCRGCVLAAWQSCFTKFVTCARLLQPLFHVCVLLVAFCVVEWDAGGNWSVLRTELPCRSVISTYLCPCFSLNLLVSLSLGSCDPGPPPPVSISTAQQRVYVCIFIVVEQGVCGHRGACCAVTTEFLVGTGQLCIFCILLGEVACRTACDPCPPPPAFKSTAQQRVYFFIFVEVKRGVCEHRGAWCTSTTMFFGGQLCVLFILLGGVACGTACDPCPPPPVSILTAQQHVHLFVFVEGERGVREHRGACCTSTTMAFGGQLCDLFMLCGWVGGLWHHV